MGVRNTFRLTREEAGARFTELYLQKAARKAVAKAAAKLAGMDNEELECRLEMMVDEEAAFVHGGHGYESFIITDGNLD